MRWTKGFSLVEIVIVVLILAALAAIAIPTIIKGSTDAKINACKSNIDSINKAIELYHLNTGTWPSKLKGDFLENTDYFPDDAPECPFGDKYKMDDDTHRVETDKHNH